MSLLFKIYCLFRKPLLEDRYKVIIYKKEVIYNSSLPFLDTYQRTEIFNKLDDAEKCLENLAMKKEYHYKIGLDWYEYGRLEKN